MREFDPVNYLDNEVSISAFLQTAAEGDAETRGLLRDAVSHVLKARAINQLVVETGIDREMICETLRAETKPNPVIIAKITATFGVTPPVHA